MQQNQRREKGVQVDVERIAPLDVRIDLAPTQIPIGHQPHERRHDYAANQKVHNQYVEQEVAGLTDAQVQGPRNAQRSHYAIYKL